MTANRLDSAGMTRRHFLGHLSASAMALPAMQFLGAMQAQAQNGNRPIKSCIVLWMGGGPSQLDTWSLKPGSKNGGEFKPIDTAVPGVQICEHLPTIAGQMKHLSIVRSLNSNEGNHDRGTYKMHTGYVPNPTVVHPGFGSILSYELGSKRSNFDLPHCISINGSPFSAGFLGMTHAPFDVNSSGDIPNLKPPAGVEARLARRLAMLNMVETNFIAEKRGQEAIDHKEVYDKTYRMMSSRLLKAFDLKSEPEPIKEKYGKNSFGQGCLLARKLVEAGVTYVEVSLGGWDNHNNIFDTLKGGNLPTLDKGMGSLVEDLAQRGLLDSTLIVWMGDFGRTPRPLAQLLVGGDGRWRHQGWPGRRRDRQGRRGHHRPPGGGHGFDRHHDQGDGHPARHPIHHPQRSSFLDHRQGRADLRTDLIHHALKSVRPVAIHDAGSSLGGIGVVGVHAELRTMRRVVPASIRSSRG